MDLDLVSGDGPVRVAAARRVGPRRRRQPLGFALRLPPATTGREWAARLLPVVGGGGELRSRESDPGGSDLFEISGFPVLLKSCAARPRMRSVVYQLMVI